MTKDNKLPEGDTNDWAFKLGKPKGTEVFRIKPGKLADLLRDKTEEQLELRELVFETISKELERQREKIAEHIRVKIGHSDSRAADLECSEEGYINGLMDAGEIIDKLTKEIQ